MAEVRKVIAHHATSGGYAPLRRFERIKKVVGQRAWEVGPVGRFRRMRLPPTIPEEGSLPNATHSREEAFEHVEGGAWEKEGLKQHAAPLSSIYLPNLPFSKYLRVFCVKKTHSTAVVDPWRPVSSVLFQIAARVGMPLAPAICTRK